MTPSTDESRIAEVVDAHRALAAAGQSDLIWGHVGIRDPDGRGVWSKASGWGMNELDAERVVLVSFEGDVLVGGGPRHIEVFIHLELMKARPDVQASVHSHAIESAAFASLDVPLRALTHAATPFLGEDVPRFLETGDLIRTPELGRSLAAAVGPENGVLIPGHGLVTVGESVAAAVMHAVLLNSACQAQLLAAAAGGPRRWSAAEEVAAKRDRLWPPHAMQAAYEHLVREGRGHSPQRKEQEEHT